MNTIQSIFSPEITEALGWTIIHALWQGFLILTCLLILLIILSKNSSQVRYIISFTALIIMFAWSASTFAKAYQYAREKQELKVAIVNNPDFLKELTKKQIENTTETTFINKDVNVKLIKIRAWFQRNFPLLLSFWLIGIGLFTVRLIGGLAYNKRLRGLQLLPFEEKWMDKLKKFAQDLNISRNVKAYKSPHTSNPITLGFLKPIILFPVKAFTGLTEKEIEAIIAHELAHIVRHDYLFNILQSIIEIIFFYHPAIWSISRHIREEREHSCDDIAITLTGDRVTYAKALTQAQLFSMQQENLAMAFGREKGGLLQRIKRIQKQRIMKTNITEGIIASIIIISSIFLVSFSVGNQFNPDTISNNKITLIKDSIPDIQPNHVHKIAVKINKDSVMNEIEKNMKSAHKNEKISKEVKQALEIALSETDNALSAEIIKDINITLKEIKGTSKNLFLTF